VVMVTFVPAFVSPEAAAWDARLREEWTGVKASVTDTVEQQRLVDEWKTTHPTPRATLKQVADHIEHVRNVAGVDHVGIGSDFDGIDTTPEGLEDVSAFPQLFAELIRRGWTDADLKKLAGQNLLRAFRAAEATAARLQKTRRPSTKTIEELDGVKAEKPKA
jgi:membrane dipeptidase